MRSHEVSPDYTWVGLKPTYAGTLRDRARVMAPDFDIIPRDALLIHTSEVSVGELVVIFGGTARTLAYSQRFIEDTRLDPEQARLAPPLVASADVLLLPEPDQSHYREFNTLILGHHPRLQILSVYEAARDQAVDAARGALRRRRLPVIDPVPHNRRFF